MKRILGLTSPCRGDCRPGLCPRRDPPATEGRPTDSALPRGGLTISLLALLTLSCAGRPTKQEAETPLFTFAQITDSHCVMVAADATEPPARAALNVGGYKLYWKDLPNSFARLEETAAFLNGTVKADFLIHTGDITDLGRLEDLRRAQKIMASLKRPFFALMGNDDMGEPQAEFEKHRGDSNFVKTFGALNTVFDYSGWRFILLSAFPGDADMEWLRRQLDGSAGRPTVLCTHPLVIADNLTQVMSAYYGGSLLMARADEVEAMIREHPNVVAVLSGHCHCTFHWTRHGTEYFTTAALVGLPATVRVFSVYKGRMEVATWTADSVQDMQAGKWKKANSERIEYRTEN